MQYDGPERRRHERKPVNIEVRYRAGEGMRTDCALNISRHGMFIKTRSPLPAGSEAEFELSASGASLKLPGKVIRVIGHGKDELEPEGMAIEFHGMGDDQWSALLALAGRERDKE